MGSNCCMDPPPRIPRQLPHCFHSIISLLSISVADLPLEIDCAGGSTTRLHGERARSRLSPAGVLGDPGRPQSLPSNRDHSPPNLARVQRPALHPTARPVAAVRPGPERAHLHAPLRGAGRRVLVRRMTSSRFCMPDTSAVWSAVLPSLARPRLRRRAPAPPPPLTK